MKSPLEGRWLGLAALIAAGIAGVLVLAVRFVRVPVPPPSVNSIAPSTRGIGIASSNSTTANAFLREQSLLDPDPLFLPTEYNASQPRLPSFVRREPDASFQPVSAKYAYTVASAPISFPEVAAVPAQPVEALTFGRVQNPYEVFGRFEREEKPLSSRQAFIEVVYAKTGRVVFSSPLVVPDAPAQLATGDWRPLELLVAVDATGLVGLPVLARGSDVEAIDRFFRSYLAKQFRLGERLPSGFYSVRVGP